MLKGFYSLTEQTQSTIIVVLVLCLVSIIVSFRLNKLKPEDKTPLWLVPLFSLVDAINNLCKDNLGKNYKVYAPYIVALSMYLLAANTAGIFGLTPPTSYIINNAVLAFLTFLIIQVSGIVSQGLPSYIKGFFEPMWFLFPINLISEISLPVSLTLRLLGNILSSTVLSMLLIGLLKWFAIPILPGFNAIFDIGFGAIQTLVFVLLTVVFASMKITDEDKLAVK